MEKLDNQGHVIFVVPRHFCLRKKILKITFYHCTGIR